MDRWFWVWVVVVALFQFFESAGGVDVKWTDSSIKVEKVEEKKTREPSAGNMSGIKEADGPKGNW